MEILHTLFRDGSLPMYCMWLTVVLIHKVNGEFRGIRLVEVLRKESFGVINRQIGTAVQFNDVLHGFRAGQGTSNASLKSKLLYNLMAMREEVLYEVLLDLRKAYDALGR